MKAEIQIMCVKSACEVHFTRSFFLYFYEISAIMQEEILLDKAF